MNDRPISSSQTPLFGLLQQGSAPGLWILRSQNTLATQQTLAKVLGLATELKAATHYDLLIVAPDDSNTDYKVEALEEFFAFTQFSPLQWKQKVAIFTRAQALGPIVANKLLKIFEDPPPFLTVGLIVDGQKSLLATIESRALTWFLPNESSAQISWPSPPAAWPSVFSQYLITYPEQREMLETLWRWAGKKISTQEATQMISDLGEAPFQQFLTELLTFYASHFELINQHQQWEVLCQNSRTYHNPANERIVLGLRLWAKWTQIFPQGPC